MSLTIIDRLFYNPAMRPKNSPSDREAKSFADAARRTQIVGCAIESLAELGYARTSLARIAERAQISKSVISYHFTGKDELMKQIVTFVYTRGAHFMLPRIEAEATAHGMLKAAIEANLEFIATNREAVIAATEVITNFRKPGGRPHFDMTADEPNVQGVEWILKKGQKDGDFRAFDTRVMALTIRAAIDRSAAQLAAEPGLDWKAYARELCVLFDHATRKTGTQGACEHVRH